jgi:hypothetical protein
MGLPLFETAELLSAAGFAALEPARGRLRPNRARIP